MWDLIESVPDHCLSFYFFCIEMHVIGSGIMANLGCPHNNTSPLTTFIIGLLLLWFLTVTCSCCPYLYFGSPVM